nr:hypothetical protein CYJ24_04570 [Actinomyces naeslundii]
MSTALTLTPNRDCTPVKNRRIPTIPAGCFDGRLAHVSAVDTGDLPYERTGAAPPCSGTPAGKMRPNHQGSEERVRT